MLLLMEKYQIPLSWLLLEDDFRSRTLQLYNMLLIKILNPFFQLSMSWIQAFIDKKNLLMGNSHDLVYFSNKD